MLLVATYMYVVEASIPTIILFCVICKGVDDLYKWQTFQPNGLHDHQISHGDPLGPAKSGADEGHWAERLPFI